jgi:hypothetical protein
MPQEYLTIPAFKTYPFGFADCEADAAAMSGALRTPFIQQRITMPVPSVLCQANVINMVNRKSSRPWARWVSGTATPCRTSRSGLMNGREARELSEALYMRVIDHWSDDPAGDLARQEKTVDTALALQPDNSWLHYAKGHVYTGKR